MDGQAARLGDVVLYRMDTANATRLNRIRVPWGMGGVAPEGWPRGAQAHVGYAVSAGQQYPAIVVSNRNGLAGLQVFLDGADTLWVPGAKCGGKEGEYVHRC